MARDRQRAKRRRRAASGPGPGTTRLHRDNVPGELDHASGQVEEFEAAIVAGGEGTPLEEDLEADVVPDEPAVAEVGSTAAAELDPVAAQPAELEDELEDEDETFIDEDEPAAPAPARVPRSQRERPHAGQPAAAAGGNRTLAFLRASWAELQRVQWPDRRQVAQATAVVIGFVLIAGAYLGIADWLAQRLVDFII